MSEIFTIPLLVAAKAQNILGDDYKVMYTHNHKNQVTLYDVWNVVTGKAVKIIIDDDDDFFLGSATPRYIAREAIRRLGNE
jgi:hypothetical protein